MTDENQMTPLTTPAPESGFVLSETAYKRLKWFTTIVLPAFITLYIGLGALWGIPAVDKVTGTLALINTFLGIALGISTKTYNASDARFDGRIDVVTNGMGTYRNVIDIGEASLDDLENLSQLTLKVNPVYDPTLRSSHPDIDDDVPTE